MGAGPEHLLGHGLADALGAAGRKAPPVTLCSEKVPPAEVATAFELDGLISAQVRAALADGQFPLVLSGNCNALVGTIAGAGGLGVVWFDAHADFDTPETTTTGFTDGMGLAVAVGHCWQKMAEGVPGFAPVAEEDVLLTGVRDVQPAEEERLAGTRPEAYLDGSTFGIRAASNSRTRSRPRLSSSSRHRSDSRTSFATSRPRVSGSNSWRRLMPLRRTPVAPRQLPFFWW